jgi:hypothetical protein
LVESEASNETGAQAGTTITGLKVGEKLKALGTGFSDLVRVLADPVRFVRAIRCALA